MPTPNSEKSNSAAKRFGLSEREWEWGRKKTQEILSEVAARRQTIAYSELSQQLTSIHIGARDPAMDALLSQVSEEEDSHGRGMLSVLVVHKQGDKRPGEGFFDCAAGLGKDISDREIFWISEIRRVYE